MADCHLERTLDNPSILRCYCDDEDFSCRCSHSVERHVIVLTRAGLKLDAQMLQEANLCPVQCTLFGHRATSGCLDCGPGERIKDHIDALPQSP